jgi:phage terminase large subunit
MEIDVEIFEKQMEFLEREERIVLFDAGIGSGKTAIGTLWLILHALKYPKTRWFLVSRDHKQLIKSCDVELRKNLERCGLKQGIHFIRRQSPSLEYQFRNGSTIEGGSSINYDSVFRGPSVSGGLFDELDYWSEKAFKTALGRIRVAPEKVRCLTSPKGFNFVYDYFYKSESPNRYVVKGSAFDNPLLSKEYLNDLAESYGPKLYQQEVLGERLNLGEFSAYYEFNRARHINKQAKYIAGQPVYIGLDFNVQHNSAVVAHYLDKKFIVFDEIKIVDDSDTFKMADKIKLLYGNAPKIIPDSSGSNRSTKGGSDLIILKNKGFEVMHTMNPHVIDRVLNTNRLLALDRVMINPKCESLIKDLERVSWKNNKLDQITDKSLTHMSDGFGYLTWKLDPIVSTIVPRPIKFS